MENTAIRSWRCCALPRRTSGQPFSEQVEQEEMTTISYCSFQLTHPSDAAGGWVTPDTFPTALVHGVDPHMALEANDAYNGLRITNQLLTTGPTLTNVMNVGIGLVAS